MRTMVLVTLVSATVHAEGRPSAGADVAGPVAPAAPLGRRAPLTLDLGADRAPTRVKLPVPPRGGAATFRHSGGRRGWIANLPQPVQLPAPAFGGGRVYVSGGFETRSFYAFDAQDGRLAWAQDGLNDNGPSAPLVDPEGRVIFNTESCTLFVFDGASGKERWHKWLGDPTLAQPAYADGLIYASHPGQGFQLSAYRVTDGKEMWSAGIDGELLGAPIVHGDALYATSVGGTVYRFDRRTGKKAWARAHGASSAPWAVGEELFVSLRGQGMEEQVVLAAGTGNLLRRVRAQHAKYLGDVPADLRDWKKVWSFEGSRPVVVGGLQVEATGGTVRAADAKTGAPLWTRRFAPAEHDRSLGSLAVAGPQVVVATRTGDLYGLDVDTGYTIWSVATGKRIVAQPIVAKGWVYASTEDGSVIGLEIADASLDGWHMWGGGPGHN